MTKKGNTNKELEELRQKLPEMENNWKRALADYKNLQNKMQEERTNLVDFANTVLIEQLLSVLDNFDLLAMHTEDVGLKLCIKDFHQTLENAGLEELKINDGDNYNHDFMEAVDTLPGEKNKVMQVLRKAYKFRNKIIRPGGVKVGSGE